LPRSHPPQGFTEKLFDFVLPFAQASAISIKRLATWTGLFVTNAAQVLIVGLRQENRVAGVWIYQICEAALTLPAIVFAQIA